jgi:hypothetical protein
MHGLARLGQLKFPKQFDRQLGRRDVCNAIETTGRLGRCRRYQQCTTRHGQQESSSVHHALPKGVHGQAQYTTPQSANLYLVGLAAAKADLIRSVSPFARFLRPRNCRPAYNAVWIHRVPVTLLDLPT